MASSSFARALAIATVFFNSASALPLANPLVPALYKDFPDPAALKVGDTYFAYATNRNSHNVQVATSSDFINWNLTNKDALPKTGAWSNNKAIWAPDVIQLVGYFLCVSNEVVTGVLLSRQTSLSSCTIPRLMR